MIGRFALNSRDYREPAVLAHIVARAVEQGTRWTLIIQGAAQEYDDWEDFHLNLQRELESRWSDQGQVGVYEIEAHAWRDERRISATTIYVERP